MTQALFTYGYISLNKDENMAYVERKRTGLVCCGSVCEYMRINTMSELVLRSEHSDVDCLDYLGVYNSYLGVDDRYMDVDHSSLGVDNSYLGVDKLPGRG